MGETRDARGLIEGVAAALYAENVRGRPKADPWNAKWPGDLEWLRDAYRTRARAALLYLLAHLPGDVDLRTLREEVERM